MVKLKEIWISNRSELRLDFDDDTHHSIEIKPSLSRLDAAIALERLSIRLFQEEPGWGGKGGDI